MRIGHKSPVSEADRLSSCADGGSWAPVAAAAAAPELCLTVKASYWTKYCQPPSATLPFATYRTDSPVVLPRSMSRILAISYTPLLLVEVYKEAHVCDSKH